MMYGYCRVSTKKQTQGNSLEEQRDTILKQYPGARIYLEQYTGKTTDRPIFKALLSDLQRDDILIVTKLDRFCRSTKEGLELIDELLNRGVRIHILNMGIIEDTSLGRLLVTCLLAFAEFERSMIIERTQEGRAIARTKDNYREGRPKAYTKEQIENALSLLTVNGGNKSYKEVERLLNISKSILIRENNKRKVH